LKALSALTAAIARPKTRKNRIDALQKLYLAAVSYFNSAGKHTRFEAEVAEWLTPLSTGLDDYAVAEGL